MAGSCEYGNDASGSIEGREFFYQLSVLLTFKELRSMELRGLSCVGRGHTMARPQAK